MAVVPSSTPTATADTLYSVPGSWAAMIAANSSRPEVSAAVNNSIVVTAAARAIAVLNSSTSAAQITSRAGRFGLSRI